MKPRNRFSPTSYFTSMTGLIIAVALLTLTGPVTAFAANTTSAGATIHNYVSVNYQSGNINITTYAAVDVTVLPVFAAPSITKPSDQLVVAGSVSYTTTVTSNSNGQDTIVLDQTISPSGMSGGTPSTTFSPVSGFSLWGGLAVSVASQNVINLPGASLTGTAFLTAIGSPTKPTVMIGGKQYNVLSSTTGHIAATTAGGGQTSEQYDTITVSPVDGTSNITSLSAGASSLEYKSVTYSFTAGTPSTPGTDGHYDHTMTAKSGGDNTKSTTTGTFVTTVQSPNVTITKLCAVNPGWAIGSLTVTNYTSSCSAKPGQTIEYLITLTNRNSNASSVASLVKVQDPVTYAYTTYTASSTYAGNGTTGLTPVAGDGVVSPLVAAPGYSVGTIAGGFTTENVTNQAFIVYRVTVN
jgi:hypothetical protein